MGVVDIWSLRDLLWDLEKDKEFGLHLCNRDKTNNIYEEQLVKAESVIIFRRN